MSKYKFIKEKNVDNKFDTTEITFNVDTIDLNDLIYEFELFLKASGFNFDGNLEIVDLEVGTDD